MPSALLRLLDRHFPLCYILLMNATRTPASTLPYRRRIILIKRALQMKYVVLVFVSVLLTVTIVSLDVYYVLGKLFIQEFGDASLPPLIKNATRLLGIHFSIYFLIVIFISIFVSHKFAGPIFRLERISEAVAEGNLAVKVTLRRGDELFETAETINRMIESLREKIQKEKNLSDRISRKLENLSERLKQGELTPQSAASILEELAIEVRHIVSNFKLQ